MIQIAMSIIFVTSKPLPSTEYRYALVKTCWNDLMQPSKVRKMSQKQSQRSKIEGGKVLLTLASDLAFVCRDSLVCRLFFGFSKPQHLLADIKRHFPTAYLDNNLLKRLQCDLIDYFRGRHVDFKCRIDLSWASDFDNRVLRGCSRIKPAETASYKELAQQIDSPLAARAVGSALSRNRIPLIIPCHRVIASNGSLGGFSAPGGIDMKKRLLDHEARMTNPNS